MADFLSKKEPYVTTLGLERGSAFLFYLALGSLFIIAALAGGLLILNRSQNDVKQNVLEEVRLKEDGLKTEIIGQIFLLDERLKNLRALLSGHIFLSNVFRFLEQNTLSTTRFLNFNFDVNSGKLDATAEATNYAAVARQINILERDPQAEKVEFGGLSIGGNNLANFKVTVIFKKSFLLLKP